MNTFSLGYVKDLRESMDIPKKYEDDCIVMKFGQTDDLLRRTTEHKRDYEKIKNVQVQLKYFVYIDICNIVSAETALKEYFNLSNMMFKYKDHKELIICDKDTLNKNIKKKFQDLAKIYGTTTIILNEQVKNLQSNNEKIELRCENKILKLKNEHNEIIAALEKDKLKTKIKLTELQCENELLKLKLKNKNH